MLRHLLVLLTFVCACSSGGSDDSSGSENTGVGACPDISGSWTVASHCDASLVGMTAVVSQNECSLSFAAPFDGFSGKVLADGSLTLSGPQSCTGTSADKALNLMCTPGSCTVKLTR